MKSNFINENISNILKPKDFKNKFYYVENTAQNLPAFIFKIKRVEYDVALCEVLYNAFSIDGASFFNVNINGDFVLPIEDWGYHEFKELDNDIFYMIDGEINELNLLKQNIKNILNES